MDVMLLNDSLMMFEDYSYSSSKIFVSTVISISSVICSDISFSLHLIFYANFDV